MARKPKQRAEGGKPAKSGGRAGATGFALVVFLLIAGAAAVVAWLQLTYDPAAELTVPVVEAEMATPSTAAPPTGQPPAKTGNADADAAPPSTADAAPATTPPAVPGTPAQPTSTQPTATPPDTGQQTASTPPPAAPEILELAPVPDPALVKQTPTGPLPVIAPDGRTPLQVYARPHRQTGRPRVAVVLGSLGLSRAATTAAIQQLPAPITLAFAPYGRDLQDYVALARAAGHEVMLQLPMEPVDYPANDPGPHTLLTTLPARKNLERLDWLLGRFTGYVGVMNYMGSRFTASDPHLRPILVALRDRGLMFLDARATGASVAFNVAQDLGMPSVANDRYVDDEASRPGIDKRLNELERLAKANGQAVGLAFPYPVTIERLAQWARQLDGRGVDLVPVSALIKVEKQAG